MLEYMLEPEFKVKTKNWRHCLPYIACKSNLINMPQGMSMAMEAARFIFLETEVLHPQNKVQDGQHSDIVLPTRLEREVHFP